MIKNLIFDFGKVLVDYDYFAVLDHIFATHEQAADFHHHLMADKWNECLDREDEPFKTIISGMQQAMPHYKDEIRTFGNRYTDIVLGEVKGMRQLLVNLKAEGYKLYGLSNWCSKVHVTMAQYPIFQLLDGRVISSEEHIVKPSAAIYHCLCHRFGLKAEECVFTDDMPENVEGARKTGMHAICFKNAAQYETELRRIVSLGQRDK